MEFFDKSAQAQVHMPALLQVSGVRHFVAVVVHFRPAVGAHHLSGVGHGVLPRFRD
jgi:hypothetical protein